MYIFSVNDLVMMNIAAFICGGIIMAFIAFSSCNKYLNDRLNRND